MLKDPSAGRCAIRPASIEDAGAIAGIYNHYVLKTVATFEEEPVSPPRMAERIQEVAAAGLPWLVAERDGTVIGYAYAGKWKGRCAYRFSVEITIYLSPAEASRGLGTRLYEALFAILRRKSIHAVIGGIALPNPASIALHEKFGMKSVGCFPEVGFKLGRWVDVGYWQAVLDPNSPSDA